MIKRMHKRPHWMAVAVCDKVNDQEDAQETALDGCCGV